MEMIKNTILIILIITLLAHIKITYEQNKLLKTRLVKLQEQVWLNKDYVLSVQNRVREEYKLIYNFVSRNHKENQEVYYGD